MVGKSSGGRERGLRPLFGELALRGGPVSGVGGSQGAVGAWVLKGGTSREGSGEVALAGALQVGEPAGPGSPHQLAVWPAACVHAPQLAARPGSMHRRGRGARGRGGGTGGSSRGHRGPWRAVHPAPGQGGLPSDGAGQKEGGGRSTAGRVCPETEAGSGAPSRGPLAAGGL